LALRLEKLSGGFMTTSLLDPAINRVRKLDSPVHDWYRFVLSFPPHLVRDYLDKFGINDSHFVLDPFTGTGTTVVECKKRGIRSGGIEANPVAQFAASTKKDWDMDPDSFLTYSQQVLGYASAGPYLDFNEDQVELLVSKQLCVSDRPLRKCQQLRWRIMNDSLCLPYRKHYLLALTKTLVQASNLKFSPEVGLGEIKDDFPVFEVWEQEVATIAADLAQFAHRKNVEAIVHKGDARNPAAHIEHDSIDAVITSPPYPNEKDYTRSTRLESVFLGYLTNKEDLKEVKHDLLRSNSKGILIGDRDCDAVANIRSVQEIAEAIAAERLARKSKDGFSRKYADVVRNYFGGMAIHMEELRPCLKPGAQLAYVVGDQASFLQVHIKTGEILAEIAETLGYEVTGIDLFRQRQATVTGVALREEVVCLRWKGNDAAVKGSD
jgi:DNA modification methylase